MRTKEIEEIVEDLEYAISKVEDIPATPLIEIKKKVKEIKQDLLEAIKDLKENHAEK